MGICERSTLLTVADGTCHFLLKERKNKEINGKSCYLEVIADGIGYLNIQYICKKKTAAFIAIIKKMMER